jgi:hypothetical protein
MRTSGKHARYKPHRIAADIIDIGQAVGEVVRGLPNHRDRDIAETGFLRQYGQKSLDHALRETVADHDTVNVACVEMPGGIFDAERTDQLDMLA